MVLWGDTILHRKTEGLRFLIFINSGRYPPHQCSTGNIGEKPYGKAALEQFFNFGGSYDRGYYIRF